MFQLNQLGSVELDDKQKEFLNTVLTIIGEQLNNKHILPLRMYGDIAMNAIVEACSVDYEENGRV